MTDNKLYVYSIVPDGDYQPQTTGIDDAPLHIVGNETGPRAVVHSHEGGPYDGPDEDVKRWVLQHSDVVEEGWEAAGAVLPMSFNVIVQSDDDHGASAEEQLKSWLATSEKTLTGRLSSLAGKSELRVEISLNRSQVAAEDPNIGQLQTELQSRPAGVQRLLQKRLEKISKETADMAADQAYPGYRARVAAHCVQIQEYRHPSRQQDLVPVLSASCLVEEERKHDLGVELSAIKNENSAVTIRFLGPWPPYSFVESIESDEGLVKRSSSRE
ncbi:GvpL/GvpF family gas vesicle protein [Rothia uropygialis]|uniref:GvpL/GvpF family gas vesicle protein n=1 Tax=Kocuria sp. 36 TaxID=1415402 RepID=UPI00101DD4E8|nr:GvpL/GvpF family gas vesicle protein [Kocuria sp. 36]